MYNDKPSEIKDKAGNNTFNVPSSEQVQDLQKGTK